MGKPTGFMEYQRELPADRAPLERIKDWREFHLHFEREAENRQLPLHDADAESGHRPPPRQGHCAGGYSGSD